MKQWYTAKELAGLPGLPSTERRIRSKAEAAKWESQQRAFGKGYEYHVSNLPLEAKKALEAQQINELMPRLHESKNLAAKPASTQLAGLNERQRSTADSRATVITAIKAMADLGVTQEAAITTLLSQAVTGALVETNPVLDKALQLAKDPRGNSDSNYPSARSIKRWLAKEPTKLAPESKRELKIPEWANDFLLCWQRPEKPSVEHAYRQFVAFYQGEDQPPSIHAVRRFIKKMGNVSKQQGRMGARELKNILPFVRRDFSNLLPADVYSADGHTHDGEVQHPFHGRPFRPEITTFIDIGTRRVVGVSVDLAESSIAVLDALISSCTQAIPALIYVDNGGGYVNAMLKDEATGVMARLGSTMTHSLPYSSQARGVIERVHQTLWVDAAKGLNGFVGKDMDQEARHEQFKLSRKAVKHGGTMPLMGWEAFLQTVYERINWYNSRPHSTLPKITDEQGKRRHQTPDERWNQYRNQGWEPITLTGDDAAQVFRPRTTRTANRGEIKFMSNIYFSHELTEWHGEQVHIAYDINDPQFIWVYEPETGVLITKAELNGNRQDYMPRSVVEQARERRAIGRKNRLEVKLEEVNAELNGRPALEQEEPVYIPGVGAITPDLINSHNQVEEAELIEEPSKPTLETMTPSERINLYRAYQNGQPVPEHHAFWFKTYGKSKEFSAWAQRNEQEMGPEARTL
ncbi:MAG: Mu transposase C-terminal domain-containing protein [Neptuniibacter sp.]